MPLRSLEERQRRRIYFTIMLPCLTLIILAWGVVQFFSVNAAIAMSAVAMFLPPIAAIMANAGRD
jgi:hypothetical protein